MPTEINTCGYSCPQPVLMFMEASKKDTTADFEVLVDNEASRENVSRAALNHGYQVTVKDEGNGISRLVISR